MLKLLNDNTFEDVEIYANKGYTIMYNYSKRIDDMLFIVLGVKKDSGVFNSSDSAVCYLNSKMIPMTSYCALGHTTDWQIGAIGYCFISSSSIIVSDRNGSGIYDRAYINIAVRLNDL